MLPTWLLLVFAWFAFICDARAQNDSPEAREGIIKAGCLYHLAKFVEWPKSSLKDDADINLCIIGQDPLNQFALETMHNKNAGNHTLKVRFFNAPSDRDITTGCQIVYFGTVGAKELTQTLTRLAERPILTVGGSTDITDSGGMVFLMRREKRLAIKIDLNTANRSGLKLSSELLQIAELKR